MNSTVAAVADRYAQMLKDLRKAPGGDGFDLPDVYAHHLDHYVYPVSEKLLASVRPSSTDGGYNDTENSATFIITYLEEDRDGDVVIPKGCYLENYRRSPGVFFGHQDWPVAIGISERPDGTLAVGVEENRCWAKVYFDMEDPDAAFIAGKVKRKILRGCSVAFVPLEARRRDEYEQKAAPRTSPMMPPGWTFVRWDMTEWSIVGVGSNPKATLDIAGDLRDSLDREKSFLTPRMQKGLRQYAAVANGCWNGWCPCPPCGGEEKIVSTQVTKAAARLPESVVPTDPLRWNKGLSDVFEVSAEHLPPSSTTYEWVAKYLQCHIKDIHQSTTGVPAPRMGSFLTGLNQVLAGHKLVDTRNIGGRYKDGSESPLRYETLQLNSKLKGHFLVHGTQFWEEGPRRATARSKGSGGGALLKGRRFILKFAPDFGGLDIDVFCEQKHAPLVGEIIDEAWRWAKSNNFLKGEAFALSGEFLPRTDEGWEDVFLEGKNIKTLKRVTDLFNNKQTGFANRGIILLGPPGTGKTLSGRILRNQANGTYIWMSSRDFHKSGGHNGMLLAFEMAKELAPSIIFMEDVDNWLDGYVIDTLKTEMDGISRSKGVLTVLTTNFPERMPEALIDRPGRFHDVLNFDLPSPDARKSMLRKWLEGVPAVSIDEAVKRTQGFSGAHVFEMAHFARTLSEHDGLPPSAAVLQALEKIEEQKELINQIHLHGSNYSPFGRKENEAATEKAVPKVVKKKAPCGCHDCKEGKPCGCKAKAKEQPSDSISSEKACILPTQELQGWVSVGSKAWYSGEAVRVRTASGEILAVTTNHPVLTVEGFVPAGDLCEGQDLLHYIGEGVPTPADGHKQNTPTPVEEVFESLAGPFARKELCGVSRLDFHGDAESFEGDVEIVRSHSLLADYSIPETAKGVYKGVLAGNGEHEALLTSSRGSRQIFDALSSSGVGSMSSNDLGLSLGGGHHTPSSPLGLSDATEHSSVFELSVDDSPPESGLGGDVIRGCPGKVVPHHSVRDTLWDHDLGAHRSSIEQLVGCGAIPKPHSGFQESRSDRFETEMVPVGQSLDGGPCAISADENSSVHFGVRQHAHAFGSAAELDARLSKFGSDRRIGSTILARKLCNEFASKVVPDEIVGIDRFHYEGPVYDFQSPLGYILVERLIVSNCQILEDGEVNGKPLTEDQRKMFGAACEESKKKALAEGSGAAGGYTTPGDDGTTTCAVCGKEIGAGEEAVNVAAGKAHASCVSTSAATPDSEVEKSTRTCPHCGAENSEEAKLCSSCGASLSTDNSPGEEEMKAGMKCPDCGADNPGDAKYCIQCGTALGGAEPEVEKGSCPGCGAQTTSEMKYCPQCGAKLSGEDADGGPGVGKGGPPVVEKRADPVDAPAPPAERMEGTTDGDEGTDTDEDSPPPDSDTIKHSAEVLAKLHAHAQSEAAYIDEQLQTMDNPDVAQALMDYKESLVGARMTHLEEVLGEHHPEHQMDDLVPRVLGSEGEDTGAAPGEEAPTADDTGNPAPGQTPATDEATEEVLDRYGSPRGKGATTKVTKEVTTEPDRQEEDYSRIEEKMDRLRNLAASYMGDGEELN